MHLISLLNSLGIKGSSFPNSQTSSTSYNSVKNSTSLGLFPKGQYLNNPSTNGIAKEWSLLRKSIEHLRSYSWNI